MNEALVYLPLFTFVGRFKARQLLIAAFCTMCPTLLRRLFATPHLFQFFVFDGADLHIVTQTDAAALVGDFADHLRHGTRQYLGFAL